MRLVLPLCALLLSVAANAAQPYRSPVPSSAAPPSANGTAVAPPKTFQGPLAKQPDDGTVCHGKIETVRQERGLPSLRQDNAAPDEPLLIFAVDRMIDGCEVLVMRNDLADIRPLPDYSDSKPTLRPAH